MPAHCFMTLLHDDGCPGVAGSAMQPPLLSSPTMTQHLAAHLTVLEIARPLSQQELLAVCSLRRLHSLKMRCSSPPSAGACQIPAQVSCLQALQSLTIRWGHASQLPADISCLMRLTSMSLSNCHHCMRSVGEMRGLRELYLCGSQPQVLVLMACDICLTETMQRHCAASLAQSYNARRMPHEIML